MNAEWRRSRSPRDTMKRRRKDVGAARTRQRRPVLRFNKPSILKRLRNSVGDLWGCILSATSQVSRKWMISRDKNTGKGVKEDESRNTYQYGTTRETTMAERTSRSSTAVRTHSVFRVAPVFGNDMINFQAEWKNTAHKPGDRSQQLAGSWVNDQSMPSRLWSGNNLHGSDVAESRGEEAKKHDSRLQKSQKPSPIELQLDPSSSILGTEATRNPRTYDGRDP
ncbi:hypothetical protein B0H10DRAFT_1939134 [Mycena sp. CBHHK59/15]|nr:hypothetical protein B0H10DRAFT_1939134 [Mycena sp. CBHHK59/15]